MIAAFTTPGARRVWLVALVIVSLVWLALALHAWFLLVIMTWGPETPYRRFVEVTVAAAAVALAATAIAVGARQSVAAGFATLLGFAFLFFGTCMTAARFL